MTRNRDMYPLGARPGCTVILSLQHCAFAYIALMDNFVKRMHHIFDNKNL